MAVGKVKAFESLIRPDSQDNVLRHMDRQPAAEQAVAGDNFQVASKGDALKNLENGGVAKSAEFRAPKFFRS